MDRETNALGVNKECGYERSSPTNTQQVAYKADIRISDLRPTRYQLMF